MQILFVVQRYGAKVAGGAETHCRQLATRLAARGHRVGVVAAADGAETTAVSEDGVGVLRLAVAHPLDPAAFGPFTERAITGPRPPAAISQDLWLRSQGPAVPDLEPWLAAYAGSYDVVVAFTYLFRTFWSGVRTVAGRVPLVVHATAHDEPYFFLPALDEAFRLPDAYAWYTEEERDLLRRRGDGRRPGMVIGVGVDRWPGGDADRFRSGVDGLGDRPYLLYLGRVTAGKGALELNHWFRAYKARRPGSLALVFAGSGEAEIPDHPDVFVTGWLDDEARNDALAGTLALAQPSPSESFSMVLTEAWAAGKGAVVQGRSPVLAGQARRSGAAIAYRGYGEWEAAIELLLERPGLPAELGDRGRRYVATHYTWDTVLDRYERLLALAGDLFVERYG